VLHTTFVNVMVDPLGSATYVASVTRRSRNVHIQIAVRVPVPVPLYKSSFFYCVNQGCGSGSGLDPHSVTLWIRICIGNPDPGSRGKKSKVFQWKNALLVTGI
jgi:hypothetical protein